jgi:hypothetical protein
MNHTFDSVSLGLESERMGKEDVCSISQRRKWKDEDLQAPLGRTCHSISSMHELS